MPADYRGSIRHARRWVEMCARDMPWLDVRYVTREGKNILTGLEQAFLHNGGPVGAYHFVMQELLATLAQSGARLIMDGHGGDYTLHPRGQAALARFLARFQLRRFFSELRADRRVTGVSYWVTLKRDVVWTLLPRRLTALWERLRQGRAPLWGDQPVAPALAERLIADGAVDPGRLRIAARPAIDMRGQMLNALERQMAGARSGHRAARRAARARTDTPFSRQARGRAGARHSTGALCQERAQPLSCLRRAEGHLSARIPDALAHERRRDSRFPAHGEVGRAAIARRHRAHGKIGRLARLVDFAKIRRLLAARGPDDHNSGWEQETQLALHGYLVARYIEWVRRDNR